MVEVEEKKRGELPSFEEFKEKVEKFREKHSPMSAKFSSKLGIKALLGDLKAKVAYELDKKPVEALYSKIVNDAEYRRICLEIISGD